MPTPPARPSPSPGPPSPGPNSNSTSGLDGSVWSEDQQLSFNILKKKLTELPILHLPDFSKEFTIETDASSVGIGAMLSQKFNEGSSEISMPIAYASRSLSKAERNYGVTDLEGLAVIWAIQHFESYIHGMHFTIVTDHSALKALKDKS